MAGPERKASTESRPEPRIRGANWLAHAAESPDEAPGHREPTVVPISSTAMTWIQIEKAPERPVRPAVDGEQNRVGGGDGPE